MSESAFQPLEFSAIRRLLEQAAGSEAGRRRLARLAPSADPDTVREALSTTSEARALLAEVGRQPFHNLPDLRDVLTLAQIEGAHLEPGALLSVAAFAETGAGVARSVAGVTRAPRLAGLAGGLVDNSGLTTAIRRAVLPSGEVADDASPELGATRRALARRRVSLEGVMESFLHDSGAERLLQDKLVTTRNDRYVLLVKSASRARLPGVVHGSSGSGASVFVEPLEAVELNNDIVALADQERCEVVRILKTLTREVAERAEELERAAAAMAELDAAQACALLAEEMAACVPEIVESAEVELRDARHPLLIPALTERLGLPARSAREPVPVSLSVGGEERVLVISGPNTGGKTVALKTVGLLAAMAQAGLHVPAAPGSRLPVFRRIFADIGDEQSIAESLSTFSAHMASIVRMARELETPSLVLLDEVGAGTDPTEGGALAVAIVEHFQERGALVVVTTHHGEVKTYAHSTPGVACASFAYDPDSYEPSYRLQRGVPGRSLALEMAERLGLPASVSRRARALRDEGQLRVDDLLRRLELQQGELDALGERLDAERRALERARGEQERAAGAAEQGRREQARRFATRLDEIAEQAAREAREAIDAAVRRVEQTRTASSAKRVRARALGELGAARQRANETPELADLAGPAAQVVPGDEVRISKLRVAGRLLTLAGEAAEVAVRGKRLWVSRSELELVPGSRGPARRATERAPFKSEREAPGEINVIGLTVDEALPQVDKLLDDATLADRSLVRVIHGHGQGRLRQAVGGLLREHPHVAAYRAAEPRDGGNGVTVVELKA